MQCKYQFKMASTWEAEIEKYPNLRSSKTLPCDVECAKEENIIQAEMAFERFCPKNFKIVNVSWVRKQTVFIWRVEYHLGGLAVMPGEGDELKENFKIEKHPLNTAIINIHLSRNAIIDYGVFCECDTPNFEEAVQMPGQPPWGTLYENKK